jgi:hypothetical protein
MSISSLGRSIAAPSLREPVSPLNQNSRQQQISVDLQPTQVASPIHRPQGGRAETDSGSSQSARPVQTNSKRRDSEPSAIQESADELVEILQRDRFGLAPSGPLSRPDFRVIDQVNNIDFERKIPPEALRERIFKLREDFIADLAQDTISFDSVSGRRVIVIKEQLNEREFVRQIPTAYHENRVAYLSSFASERGFEFETTA